MGQAAAILATSRETYCRVKAIYEILKFKSRVPFWELDELRETLKELAQVAEAADKLHLSVVYYRASQDGGGKP